MFEFGARILLAGAIVLVAGATGAVGLSLAVGVAITVGALALVCHALETRGLYEGGGAGLHAGLEGLALALLLVGAGKVESLGFLVLLPHAWAVVRWRASWTPAAFAAGFALVGAYALVNGREPSVTLALQAVGVLGLGIALAYRVEEEASPAPSVAPIEDEDLRGRFRALREAYAVLERRSERDAQIATLARAETLGEISQALRDATGAAGAILFAPTGKGWESLGAAGRVPEGLEGPYANGRLLQEAGGVLLFADGNPVGAVWLPEKAREGVAGVAETLAVRLGDRMEAETERRRRQVAETRLTLVEGGESPQMVARALAGLVGADSVEFGAVGPQGATPLARFGPPCALLDALRHRTGTGLDGWIASGAPMVWIADARQDSRLDGATALRARTASFALVSLADGRAYVWAAWHAAGTGRPTALATIRASEGVVLRWIEQAAGRALATSR